MPSAYASWQINLAVHSSLGTFITISGNQIPGRFACVFIPCVLGRSAKMQITASSQLKGLSSEERPCDFRCADGNFSPSLSLPVIQEARWQNRSPIACKQHSWRAAAKNCRIAMNMALTLDCFWGVRLKKFPLGRLCGEVVLCELQSPREDWSAGSAELRPSLCSSGSKKGLLLLRKEASKGNSCGKKAGNLFKSDICIFFFLSSLLNSNLPAS